MMVFGALACILRADPQLFRVRARMCSNGAQGCRGRALVFWVGLPFFRVRVAMPWGEMLVFRPGL